MDNSYITELQNILADIRSRQGEALPVKLAAEIREERRSRSIQALIEQGSTDGERAAARAAKRRMGMAA